MPSFQKGKLEITLIVLCLMKLYQCVHQVGSYVTLQDIKLDNMTRLGYKDVYYG